ncbi:FecCD family ABC transporter permease [Shewanella intestini]|uniref:Iron ABC transporter permease n=1 Tax=Shewanella intestini TaxID=2017544 RepID=A0ABS5I465_9GAMM|nr:MULTISPECIES: iron ABC transporter permease [Shewanella]MBR9728489.1 iron ABC transporter permease [Shewanella intestini]MRG36308.1 iron chelate uptake ABC transporter family permease subunit [Shewanella sp. XMDDZSB0408]
MVQIVSNNQRYYFACVVIVFLLLITPFFSAGFGAANISFSDLVNLIQFHWFGSGEASPLVERIVIDLRLPRILLAFMAGAGLSIAGSVLQTVTRNPLADPYLFGISSGAAFGAVVVFSLFGHWLDFDLLAQWQDHPLVQLSLPLGAFIGASLSVLIVLALSGTGINSQIERMLLSGVATSFMFGALSSLVLYFSDPQAAASVLFWTLGSFARASWEGLILPTVVVIGSLLTILAFKRQIMALQAGDETAHTLGVNVVKLRIAMLLLCSLITAVLVASCGGIGFVGLMIPHTIRILLPGKSPLLLTAMLGGLFLVWVDVIARCALTNQELPVGIITSAIGSVFFLFILRHRRS